MELKARFDSCFDLKKHSDAKWYPFCKLTCCRRKGHPATFIERFQARFNCNCQSFASLLLPLTTIYICYLNAILMPDQDVSKEVLLLLGPCWDGVKKIFVLSQLGMRNLCRECFCFLNGISLGKLRTLMEKKKKEESSVTRKEGSGRRPEEATLDAELWFHDLIKNVGEQSPESDLVYLPPATKADFWREYQDDRKEQERIVSKTTFYNLWKTKFKHLKVVRRICLFLVDRD